MKYSRKIHTTIRKDINLPLLVRMQSSQSCRSGTQEGQRGSSWTKGLDLRSSRRSPESLVGHVYSR